MGRESVRAGDAEQSLIEQLLRSLGGAVYHIGTRRPKGEYQGTMQTPGVWDIEVYLPLPRFNTPGARLLLAALGPNPTEVLVKVESKKGKDARLSQAQRDYHAHLAGAGVPRVFGDYNTVIAWLVTHGFALAENFPHYRQPPGAPPIVRNPEPGGRGRLRNR